MDRNGDVFHIAYERKYCKHTTKVLDCIWSVLCVILILAMC